MCICTCIYSVKCCYKPFHISTFIVFKGSERGREGGREGGSERGREEEGLYV